METGDSLLFAWLFRFANREFVIDVFESGKCFLYDETIRRRLCHAGKSGKDALLSDLAAEKPSREMDAKLEFSVNFTIDSELLDLIRQARSQYDLTEDVPKNFELHINKRIAVVFDKEVKPYLTDPLDS